MKGCERFLGKTHPNTTMSVEKIASVYMFQEDFGKAEELYQRALKGYEAQLGKENEDTKDCAFNLGACYANSGQKQKLIAHIEKWPHILVRLPAINNYL